LPSTGIGDAQLVRVTRGHLGTAGPGASVLRGTRRWWHVTEPCHPRLELVARDWNRLRADRAEVGADVKWVEGDLGGVGRHREAGVREGAEVAEHRPSAACDIVRRVEKPCVFCAILREEKPADYVYEDARVCAFLDVSPLFKGHVLVVPKAHVLMLEDLPAEELEPLFAAVRALTSAVRRGLGADGSFVAMNNVVSQSVPHLHAHVIPRRHGDGLKHFFWPREKYASDEERHDYAARIRAAMNVA